MSRPNAPPRGAALITAAGRKRLLAEFNFLWREQRPKVTQAVAEAAAQGDRSENAEYIYGKKQLREIDRRIRFLSKRLESLQVVERLPADRGRVYFGAWVRLMDEAGQEYRYRIVGGDEIGDAQGYISINSLLARALIKKQVGDEVSVNAPGGTSCYEITEIFYSQEAQ